LPHAVVGLRLGVDAAGQDDGVQDQPSGEGRDPSKGSDDILASVQHQAAVDDNTEELVVRPHGNLRITVRMTSLPTTRSWTLSRRQPSGTRPLVGCGARSAGWGRTCTAPGGRPAAPSLAPQQQASALLQARSGQPWTHRALGPRHNSSLRGAPVRLDSCPVGCGLDYRPLLPGAYRPTTKATPAATRAT